MKLRVAWEYLRFIVIVVGLTLFLWQTIAETYYDLRHPCVLYGTSLLRTICRLR